MSKKNRPEVELLPPARDYIPEDSKAMIARVVKERIAEVLADSQTAPLAPFFERPEVSQAMRRTQTPAECNKWNEYFARWGCLICERTDARHQGCGMCATCFSRTMKRIMAIRKRPAKAPRPIDTPSRVGAALLPSVTTLARKGRD